MNTNKPKRPFDLLLMAPGAQEELRQRGLDVNLPEVTESQLATANHILVGMRAADFGDQVPGTLTGYTCKECSSEVRLAPSGQALAAKGSSVCCFQCFIMIQEGGAS